MGKTHRARLKGKDYSRTLLWHLEQDLKVRPYYRSEDLNSLHPKALAVLLQNKKGSFGPKPKNAEICQSIKAGDPKTANAQARKLLSNGVEALAFVLSTTDFANSSACEVRKAEDMQALLDGIDLSTKHVHFRTGLSSAAFLSLLAEELKRQGFASQKFYSYIEHDLFSHWLTQGSLPYSLEEAFHEK